MSLWTPSQMWKGEDAYIIGGGPSLSSFDWELLRHHNTIGCNSAFLLGAQICKITIFGDVMWWDQIGREGTEGYGGLVVSISSKKFFKGDDCPWLLKMHRNGVRGLGKDKLCWAANTGAAAVNLALVLGVRRVFLLGFDMHLSEDRKANWHDLRYESANSSVYKSFIREFRQVADSLPAQFPGCEIINVTDDSDLDCFPKVGMEAHFQKAVA